MAKNRANHECLFHVMNSKETAPFSFLSAINDVQHKVAIRIAGGCGNLNAADVQRIKEYFLNGFNGYKGILFSGGTAAYNKENGARNFMITGIPVLIAEQNPGVKVLGSFPRTDIMRFRGGAADLHLDGNINNPDEKAYNKPDAEYDELLAVQDSVDTLLGWDGDLDGYFDVMDYWRQHGAKTAILTFEGGGVTYREGVRALVQEGHKIIVVKNSGRRSEDLAAEFGNNHNCTVVDYNDPNSLRPALLKLGFLPGSRRGSKPGPPQATRHNLFNPIEEILPFLVGHPREIQKSQFPAG